MRKEHIRSRDRHNPIIPPYPRVSSAIFNVPETTLSIKGREARNPKEFQGGPIYFSLRLLVYNHNYTNRPIWPLCNLNYTSQTSVEIYGKQMVDFNA